MTTTRERRTGRRVPAMLHTLWVAWFAAACDSAQPPASCGTIPQLTLRTGEASTVSVCFNDPNGDALTYDVASSSAAVVTAALSGTSVTVTAVAPGNALVTVTATDPGGLTSQQVFLVTVQADFIELLRQFADRHGIGAAALGLVKDGEVVAAGGVGFMDAERRVPIRQDVMMRLASVSKPITAAAIRTLANDGKLALDDRAFELGQSDGGLLELDPFPQLGDSRLAEVTVLQLLQHRGGWDRGTAGDLTYREIEIARAMSISSPPGRENTVRYILGQPLQFAPGSQRVYSNIGYLVLGLIVEEVSGQDYMTYVRENIFTPLGVAAEDVIQGRTFPEVRSDREPWYDAEGLARNVYDPSGPRVRWPDGGWDHEARIAQGGLVASTPAILAFLDVYQVAGDDIGRRRSGSEGDRWAWYHTGGLPGTNTLALQRGNGVSYVFLFNRRASRGDPSYVELFRETIEEQLANLAGTAVEGTATGWGPRS